MGELSFPESISRISSSTCTEENPKVDLQQLLYGKRGSLATPDPPKELNWVLCDQLHVHIRAVLVVEL